MDEAPGVHRAFKELLGFEAPFLAQISGSINGPGIAGRSVMLDSFEANGEDSPSFGFTAHYIADLAAGGLEWVTIPMPLREYKAGERYTLKYDVPASILRLYIQVIDGDAPCELIVERHYDKLLSSLVAGIQIEIPQVPHTMCVQVVTLPPPGLVFSWTRPVVGMVGVYRA